MTRRQFHTLDQFWPYYVGEHRRPLTRQFHFIGNTNLFIWLYAAFVKRSLRLAVWGVITSYAFAWFGHFFVERNRPATFEYPVLSALADMRMYSLMWRGEMDAEVVKHVNPTEPKIEIPLEAAE